MSGILHGFYYRVLTAGYDPLDSSGAMRTGGRCNAPGIASLYFSETVHCAVSESLRASDTFMIGPFKPRLLVAAEIRLDTIVDLGDQKVRSDYGLSEPDMAESWRDSPTETKLQAVCTSLARQGVKAIRYPSAVEAGCFNIVVFTENVGEADVVRVFDTH